MNVSKHLYECIQENLKLCPYTKLTTTTLLQIKESFINEFNPKLNETWIIHTHTNVNKHTLYIYIYIYTHRQKLLEQIISKK